MGVLRGPRPRVFSLSLRTQPERGGPVRDSVDDRDGLEADLDWKHLLLFVHGFNNSETKAEAYYAEYLKILQPGLESSRIAPDAVAKLHWPGNEAIGPWSAMDFAGYPVDLKRAKQAVPPLVVYLSRLMANRKPAPVISIVGHSLGCRLIAEAMCELARGPAAQPQLCVVNLMAPAVPVALAESGKPLAPAPVTARKVIKAHSRSDWVLFLAFPVGQSLAWTFGIESAPYVEAIGRNGNPPSFGEALFCKGRGHGDYWSDEYNAGVLLIAIDGALRTLPPPAAIPTHELPEANVIPKRVIGGRELPS